MPIPGTTMTRKTADERTIVVAGTAHAGRRWAAAIACAALALSVFASWPSTEAFFLNDETRHVMTGVFFRDLLADGGWRNVRSYAERYYLQYPSLGLLVWPPLFYGIEGAVMLVFGTSLVVGKLTVMAFAAVGACFLVALVARTHDTWTAAVAGLLFVLSPAVVSFSRQVMLEVPALTFMLAALYYWVVHLDDDSRRALWLAALAAACAVLVRFDSAVIAPIFLLVWWIRGDSHRLLRPDRAMAALAALVIVAPVAWLTAVEFGNVHLDTMVAPPGSWTSARAIWRTVTFYPRALPDLVGLPTMTAALGGLVALISSVRGRRTGAPYLAMVAGVYVVFTPIAEKVDRHAFLWIPAVAALAAIGASSLRRAGVPKPSAWAAATALVVGAGVTSVREPASFLRGYAAAAEYVVAHTTASRYCLFDGFLDGNFVYHVRHFDPARRLTVLRGDKLLYASVIEEGHHYTEFVDSSDDMAALIYSYDPEYVVVEAPRVHSALPGAMRLRRFLTEHPERYRLERTFPVVASSRSWDGVSLQVYRSIARNPTPRQTVELEMLTMGTRLGGSEPEKQP
jgi:hypothetical protein